MSWKILITPQAEEDLRNIYRYIANTLLVPTTAQKQVQRIISEIKSLAEMPMRYPLVKNETWAKRNARELLIDNYIVFYLVNEQAQEVVVFNVCYNRRDIEKVLL